MYYSQAPPSRRKKQNGPLIIPLKWHKLRYINLFISALAKVEVGKRVAKRCISYTSVHFSMVNAPLNMART